MSLSDIIRDKEKEPRQVVAHKSLRANTRFAPYKRFP